MKKLGCAMIFKAYFMVSNEYIAKLNIFWKRLSYSLLFDTTCQCVPTCLFHPIPLRIRHLKSDWGD